MPASKAENEPTLVAAGAFDRSLHILIVDDQPVLCELLANFLKNDLHMVEIAQSAQQALENSKSAPSTS
ncbi:MAG: response regulator [Chthoniobacterales bacterium]|nr:response regulator [Chthoniobacterales bacterium]